MKRFTDTEKFEDDWYLSLSHEMRSMWEFIWAKCDGAGVWNPSETLIRVYIGPNMTLDRAYKDLSDRILKLPNGKWMVKGFIRFQQGGLLSANNPCHKRIRSILDANEVDENGRALEGPNKALNRPCSNSSGTSSGNEEGGTEGNTTDLPSGFPESEEMAIAHAEMAGVPKEFAAQVYHKAMYRGGVDSHEIPIGNFRSYLKTEYSYEQNRQAEKKHNGTQTNHRTDPPNPRNVGTCPNKTDYAAIARRREAKQVAGKVGPTPSPPPTGC